MSVPYDVVLLLHISSHRLLQEVFLMIQDIQTYCNVLALLDSTDWLESGIVTFVLRDSERKFLKTCILSQNVTDAEAAQVRFGRNESVSVRYRSYVSRLTRKLDTLIIHFAHHAEVSPRNARALLVSRKSYIANVLMRTGAPSLGIKQFYDVDELAVLPETAWVVPQALYALALTKSAGRNPRTTATLLARARHAVDEVTRIARCDELQIQISALHGVAASRRAKRERVSQQARIHLNSLSIRSMGIRSTIAASRLAVTCGQTLRDSALGLLWTKRYKRSCIRHNVWGADMQVEYHNQRILIWECIEEHRKLLLEMKALLPLMKRNTATWFQVTDGYAKSLMKLGRFDEAYSSLHELRRSTAYAVHPRAERTYMDLRYAYLQQLTTRTERLPSPRLHNELEDKHDIHLLLLTVIHGLRSNNTQSLDTIVTSLRRTVLRNKLARDDGALNVFSRLLQKLANADFYLLTARNSEAFTRLEVRLSSLTSKGVLTLR